MKPNYSLAKRQRDLAKKAKQQEKQARKRDKSASSFPLNEAEPLKKDPSA